MSFAARREWLPEARKFLPATRDQIAASLWRHCGLRIQETYVLNIRDWRRYLGHEWLSTTTRYIHVHGDHTERAWAEANQRIADRLDPNHDDEQERTDALEPEIDRSRTGHLEVDRDAPPTRGRRLRDVGREDAGAMDRDTEQQPGPTPSTHTCSSTCEAPPTPAPSTRPGIPTDSACRLNRSARTASSTRPSQPAATTRTDSQHIDCCRYIGERRYDPRL